ncbi:autophagy-related protein 9A-like [Asterias rubens]|uniref:autophagy-related protein 9A-like n=1 Tax=Asterias rubens TaxID=7604 RepID=UPI0014557401|nr:autophagy-related protein 9A-like [Asterias rubens]XP_033639799.1 autophagy-related protein 9A-like [Asterias rubens]
MEGIQTEYQRLESTDDVDHDERNVMLHVTDDTGKARWNHIENLDEFFARIYHYHQKHGYLCMMAAQIFELVQFIFIVLFSMFLLRCVDYSLLFGDTRPPGVTKVSLSDAFMPLNECSRNPPTVLVVCVIIAGVFWIHRVVRVIYNALHYWEIRSFYRLALKISSEDLLNLTWHDVLKRLQEVQKDQRMCIHKAELTELDIYHRILRFKNYSIAMVNKSLIPLHHRVPLLGDIVILTNGLKYNLEMILFWGPWAPFQNYWHLKEEYKRASNREELARQLSKHIAWIALANILLCPFILLWQLLYTFFNYMDLIKRDPSTLGTRRWSLYARLYLRHFNEMDHEFQARLNRGYRPAKKYMNSFTSNILAIICQNIAFFAGSILAVLVILVVYDEDVLTVEHVLTTTTILGVIITICRTFIPDENLIFCPETLMQSILAQIHYIPDSWKGCAHSYRVRDEFSQIFQFKATYFLEELLSPLITPIVLLMLRGKALDIVDFYRNFSVDVVGVGDVCSFAQMNIRNHGNPKWMTEGKSDATQYQQAEDGKTELSLVHFTMTNPKWKPPQESKVFINALKEQAHKDAHLLNTVEAENTALMTSLRSLSSLEGGYSSIMGSLAVQHGMNSLPLSFMPPLGTPRGMESMMGKVSTPGSKVRGAICSTEGPLQGEASGLLGSVTSSGPLQTSLGPLTEENTELSMVSTVVTPSTVDSTNDMNFSALYMHQLHDRGVLLQEMPSASQHTPDDDNNEDIARGHWALSDDQQPLSSLSGPRGTPEEFHSLPGLSSLPVVQEGSLVDTGGTDVNV